MLIRHSYGIWLPVRASLACSSLHPLPDWRLATGYYGRIRLPVGGTEGAWTVSGGCDPQVYLFDHLSAPVFRTNEKTSPQIPSWPLCQWVHGLHPCLFEMTFIVGCDGVAVK